uniref:Lipocalin n=1 Tax=Rhipicephalus zambeziensis TaxID=60191 RepID=A0A224YLQ3_9ACAR
MYRYINSAITFIVFFNVLRWSNSELDLKKFLNTSSRIWTYYSTQNRTLFCLNDIKVEMTDKSVVLNRSYYEGEEWNSTMMEWVFFENISDKRGAYVCMHHNDLAISRKDDWLELIVREVFLKYTDVFQCTLCNLPNEIRPKCAANHFTSFGNKNVNGDENRMVSLHWIGAYLFTSQMCT